MAEIPRPANPDDFFLVSLIGKGGFAEVWLANHTKYNAKVAIKVISKSSLRTTEIKNRFFREFNLQKKFKHPYLATVYDLLENSQNYYIVMEYLQRGTLSSKMAQEGILTETKARHYFSQIVFAIQYLHNNLRIAHRDIKAENIMIDLGDDIRLIDFGLSHEINEDEQFFTKCGSPYYIAPEIYTAQSYTKAVDVWSVGVILYYMTAGYYPFEGVNRADIATKVQKKTLSFPDFMSRDLVNLLKKMLTKDPALRITFDKILEHPWMRKCREVNPALIDFKDSDSLLERITKREETLKFGKTVFPITPKKESFMVKTYSNPNFLEKINKSLNSHRQTENDPNDRLYATGRFRPRKGRVSAARSSTRINRLEFLAETSNLASDIL